MANLLHRRRYDPSFVPEPVLPLAGWQDSLIASAEAIWQAAQSCKGVLSNELLNLSASLLAGEVSDPVARLESLSASHAAVWELKPVIRIVQLVCLAQSTPYHSELGQLVALAQTSTCASEELISAHQLPKASRLIEMERLATIAEPISPCESPTLSELKPRLIAIETAASAERQKERQAAIEYVSTRGVVVAWLAWGVRWDLVREARPLINLWRTRVETDMAITAMGKRVYAVSLIHRTRLCAVEVHNTELLNEVMMKYTIQKLKLGIQRFQLFELRREVARGDSELHEMSQKYNVLHWSQEEHKEQAVAGALKANRHSSLLRGLVRAGAVLRNFKLGYLMGLVGKWRDQTQAWNSRSRGMRLTLRIVMARWQGADIYGALLRWVLGWRTWNTTAEPRSGQSPVPTQGLDVSSTLAEDPEDLQQRVAELESQLSEKRDATERLLSDVQRLKEENIELGKRLEATSDGLLSTGFIGKPAETSLNPEGGEMDERKDDQHSQQADLNQSILSTESSAAEADALRAEISELRHQLANAAEVKTERPLESSAAEADALRAEISELRAEIAELRHQLANAAEVKTERPLESSAAEADALRAEISELRAEIAELRHQLANAAEVKTERPLESSAAEADALRAEIAELRHQLANAAEVKTERSVLKAVDKLDNKTSQKEAHAGIPAPQPNVASLNETSEVSCQMDELATLQAELARERARAEAAQAELAHFKQSSTEFQTRVQVVQSIEGHVAKSGPEVQDAQTVDGKERVSKPTQSTGVANNCKRIEAGIGAPTGAVVVPAGDREKLFSVGPSEPQTGSGAVAGNGVLNSVSKALETGETTSPKMAADEKEAADEEEAPAVDTHLKQKLLGTPTEDVQPAPSGGHQTTGSQLAASSALQNNPTDTTVLEYNENKQDLLEDPLSMGERSTALLTHDESLPSVPSSAAATAVAFAATTAENSTTWLKENYRQSAEQTSATQEAISSVPVAGPAATLASRTSSQTEDTQTHSSQPAPRKSRPNKQRAEGVSVLAKSNPGQIHLETPSLETAVKGQQLQQWLNMNSHDRSTQCSPREGDAKKAQLALEQERIAMEREKSAWDTEQEVLHQQLMKLKGQLDSQARLENTEVQVLSMRLHQANDELGQLKRKHEAMKRHQSEPVFGHQVDPDPDSADARLTDGEKTMLLKMHGMIMKAFECIDSETRSTERDRRNKRAAEKELVHTLLATDSVAVLRWDTEMLEQVYKWCKASSRSTQSKSQAMLERPLAPLKEASALDRTKIKGFARPFEEWREVRQKYPFRTMDSKFGLASNPAAEGSPWPDAQEMNIPPKFESPFLESTGVPMMRGGIFPQPKLALPRVSRKTL